MEKEKDDFNLKVLKIVAPKALIIIGGAAAFSKIMDVRFEMVITFSILIDYLFTVAAMGVLLNKVADGVAQVAKGLGEHAESNLETTSHVIKWMETSNLARENMWKVIDAILKASQNQEQKADAGSDAPEMRGLPETGH